MGRVFPILTILLVLLAAMTLTLEGCGGREEPTTSEERSVAEGEAAPEAPEAGAAGGVGTDEGQFPPPFTLPDLHGNDVSLSDFEGKVVVLDLWATWCPPCRVEIPFLVSLHEEFEDQGLVVVGVGLDQGGAADLAPFAKEIGMEYTVLVGGRSVQQAYGVTAIPTSFVIARDGRIAAKHVGYHPSMADGMRAEVVKLLELEETEA